MESHTRSVEKAEMFKCNKYKKTVLFLAVSNYVNSNILRKQNPKKVGNQGTRLHGRFQHSYLKMISCLIIVSQFVKREVYSQWS
jgi:hypothetical protein